MNILTFDIEDWYCHDNITRDFDWGKHEVRIYEGVDRILDTLEQRGLKATFFCLGWIAENHPTVVKKIADAGHQIGCHSYQHELASRFDKQQFIADTTKAKRCIEDATGQPVNLFRAPAFSITLSNLYALEALNEMGFDIDCSVFPATRDFGGMPAYGCAKPAILQHNGMQIKEFPINIRSVLGRKIVFSGGGYFRLLPYWLIADYTTQSSYVMTYFHPSDFDPEQPRMDYLPPMKRWKNRVGLKTAYSKFNKYLNDFTFVNVKEADASIDWGMCRKIDL